MNQRRQALQICANIRHSLDSGLLYNQLLGLSEVIGKAQNRPPEGESDLTIDDGLWHRLKEFRDEMSGALRDLESLR